jgi:hypothetical protein
MKKQQKCCQTIIQVSVEAYQHGDTRKEKACQCGFHFTTPLPMREREV